MIIISISSRTEIEVAEILSKISSTFVGNYGQRLLVHAVAFLAHAAEKVPQPAKNQEAETHDKDCRYANPVCGTQPIFLS